jgi:CubicO group peptidase (beta-lactamase class C family)
MSAPQPALRLAPAVLALALASGAAAAAPPPPLAERPPVADALALLDLWIAEQMAWQQAPGLAIGIVHGDDLVWARGYGVTDLEGGTPVTPSTLFRLGSITKLFTATAILQLRDAGRLALDDPLRRHLPWFEIENPFPAAPAVTLRHLLLHTGGLPREAAFPYWTTHEFPSVDEIRRALAGQRLSSPPGDEYRYSNLGMALLGAVVEAASGQPYARFIGAHITAPLGMADTTLSPGAAHLDRLATAYMRRTPDNRRRIHDYYDTGGMAPAAAIVSSLQDLARFAALQLADGPSTAEPAGGWVVAPATLREMHRAQFVYDGWSGGRGLGFAVSRRDDTTFVVHGGWIGGHRAHLLLAPEQDVAVLALVNAEDVSPGDFCATAFDVVAPAIREATADAPPAEVAPPPAEWAAYLGTYSDPWGWEYEVLVHGGDLALYDHGYPPGDDPRRSLTLLEPVAGRTFRLPDGDPVIFVLDEAGRVERVQRRYDYLYPVAE